MYDTRVTQSALMTLIGHSAEVTTVQMDDWKVVSGDEAGFVCVWDQRMASKLWEMNNRCDTACCVNEASYSQNACVCVSVCMHACVGT